MQPWISSVHSRDDYTYKHTFDTFDTHTVIHLYLYANKQILLQVDTQRNQQINLQANFYPRGLNDEQEDEMKRKKKKLNILEMLSLSFCLPTHPSPPPLYFVAPFICNILYKQLHMFCLLLPLSLPPSLSRSLCLTYCACYSPSPILNIVVINSFHSYGERNLTTTATATPTPTISTIAMMMMIIITATIKTHCIETAE